MADLNDTQVESQDETQTPVVEIEVTDNTADDAQAVSEADESKTIPFKQYKDELSKKNSEAQSLRQRLKAAEAKHSTTEAEREAIREERDALKEKLQSYEIERAVVAAASDPKIGARNPNKLIKLLDRDNLTFKDDATVEGIDSELKRLKKEWPELFVTGGADGGFQNKDVNVDFNEVLRRSAGRY